MSKELEALEDIILYLNANEPKGLYCENIETIQQALIKAEKEHKALEIIKEKVGFKFFNRTKEVKIYIVDGDDCVYLRNETGDTLLSEEQFNLLKEVLE